MFPQLFDFAVHCLSEFLDAHTLKNQDLKLGFNFPFPCHQKGLDRVRWGHVRASEWKETAALMTASREKNNPVFCPQSTLISWTKGFRCSGVEGQDVVQLLRQAIQRQKVSEGQGDGDLPLLAWAWHL